MISKIFDAKSLNEAVPKGFNGVRVPIDASVTSSLVWKEAQKGGSRYASQGLSIFWDIDLGFFSGVNSPLTEEAHILSLTLALEHFQDTLLNEFGGVTVGVCLYRGSSLGSQKDEGRKALDCLDLLAGHLPAEIPSFALLDVAGFDDPVQLASLLYNGRHTHIHFGVKGSLLPLQELGWEDGMGPMGFIGRQVVGDQPPPFPSVAICLPSHSAAEELRPAFEKLLQDRVPFRIIPESQLIQKWEGLDVLMVSSDNLDSQGLRKLKGFCAAGGKVVTMGQLLGLPYEISFVDWQGNNSID